MNEDLFATLTNPEVPASEVTLASVKPPTKTVFDQLQYSLKRYATINEADQRDPKEIPVIISYENYKFKQMRDLEDIEAELESEFNLYD